MDSTERDHFATITTLRGSVISLQGLTQEQADRIAAIGDLAEPLPPRTEVAGDKKPCGRCNGQGHWYETVEVETPSGGKVTTQKRVNCRQCGGTGSIPK